MLTLFGLALVQLGVEIVTGEPVTCIVAGSVVSRNVFDLLFTDELEEFFKIFRPIFEREARFSKTQPVPMLGDMEEAKEPVEEFYNFWYNFDSWRSFEYLDKEVNEGSDK